MEHFHKNIFGASLIGACLFVYFRRGRRKIPILSLKPFVEGCKEKQADVVEAFSKAMQTHGFCVVVDHGVGCEIVNKMRRLALDFFHLDHDVKMKCNVSNTYGIGGFLPNGFEKVAKSYKAEKSKADQVESYVFNSVTRLFPEELPKFESAVDAYESELRKLLKLIHLVSSRGLGLEDEWFDKTYKKGHNALRFAYYPATSQSHSRYGAHTDYTGFTILRTEERRTGLMVQTGGVWVEVDAPENSFIINAGDFIHRWTNDKWISAIHQVVVRPELMHKERLSLVYFTGPSHDVTIDTIPTCISPENPKRYNPILAGEYLEQKLNATNEGNLKFER